MKKIFIFFFSILIINCVNAQIGVSAAYKTFNAEDWFSLEAQSDIESYNGYNVGLDYWFRLKNQRVEFLPEISFGQYSGDYGAGELSAQFINFQLNTNIYFLDFNNDCNCPTFDKGGNFFTKGFFVQLSPGYSLIDLENKVDTENPTSTIEDSIGAFGFGIGAGLDFGLSKLITVTPIARIHYYPEAETDIFITKQPAKTTIKQIYLGLHLSIRWNDGSNTKSPRGGRPFGKRGRR